MKLQKIALEYHSQIEALGKVAVEQEDRQGHHLTQKQIYELSSAMREARRCYQATLGETGALN